MPWNPNTYNLFKNVRFQPFYDLSALINLEAGSQAIDLGCGTGEQTALLAERFPDSDFLGIDSSIEMLNKTKDLKRRNLKFQVCSIEEIARNEEKWDLIFSNAALQWSPNHKELFPILLSKLKPKGQFAVQMPCQAENALNILLHQLAQEEPFSSQLRGWNPTSSVLSIDEYSQLLFENGMEELQISVKVYPIIADSEKTLFQFIAGTALIPYMERQDQQEQLAFSQAFKARIAEHFQKFPTIYAFKRLLLYGRKA